MWLNSLQVAIIEKDTDKLTQILDETPELSNKKDVQTAMYLLREAAELIYELKDETTITMIQLKKNIDFLRSTQAPTSAKLDITS